MLTIFCYVFAAAVILQTPSVLGGWIDRTFGLKRTSSVDPVGELEDHLAEAEGEPHPLSLALAEVTEGCRTGRQAQWDPVSCINLGEGFSDGVMLSFRCAIFAVNISQRFEATTKRFLNCPDSNFFRLLPCYYNSTMTFVEDMKDLKDGVMPFFEEGEEIWDKVKQDFGKCLGMSSAVNDTSTDILALEGC